MCHCPTSIFTYCLFVTTYFFSSLVLLRITEQDRPCIHLRSLLFHPLYKLLQKPKPAPHLNQSFLNQSCSVIQTCHSHATSCFCFLTSCTHHSHSFFTPSLWNNFAHTTNDFITSSPFSPPLPPRYLLRLPLKQQPTPLPLPSPLFTWH